MKCVLVYVLTIRKTVKHFEYPSGWYYTREMYKSSPATCNYDLETEALNICTFETYQLYYTQVIFTSQSYIFLVFVCRARIPPVSITLLTLLSIRDIKLAPLFLFPVLFSSVCSEFTVLGTSTKCKVSLATRA